MMMAAEAGDATGKDGMDLAKAYYEGVGGKMPSSLAQQASKFAAFLKAGEKHLGARTFTNVWTQINGMNDAKDQRRAKAGIFEKFVKVMTDTNAHGDVLDYSDIRATLLPEGDQTDAQVKALQSAMDALGKAETATNDAKISEMIKQVEAMRVAREKVVQYERDNANRETVAPLPQPTSEPQRSEFTSDADYNKYVADMKAAREPQVIPTLNDVVDHGGMFN